MITLIPTNIVNGRVVESNETIDVKPIRIQNINKTMQGKNGSQVIASFKIFLNASTNIQSWYKVMYEGKKWEILSLYKVNNINTVINHIEVII